MKTMKKLGLMAFAALSLVMASCSGDDSQDAPSSDMTTYIFATVNGQSYKTFELNGFLSAYTTKDGATIAIAGMNENQDVMTILLTNVDQPGTYPISSQNVENRIGYGINATDVNVSSVADCDGVTGTITITALNDTKVEGTFSMTANNSECNAQTTVTNGSFRGTFPE